VICFCFANGNPRVARWALLVLAWCLTGCGGDDVQVYQVSKEQPKAPAPVMPPGHGEGSVGLPRLQYKLPAGWEETTPGEMRVASFRVPGQGGKQADVGVVPLPGLVGHDLENVNRWRATVGLPPVTEVELPKLAQPVEAAGATAQVYDQAGENPGSGEKTRILAAVLRKEGVAWFIKMNGDDELVAQQKPAFIDFLKSLTFPANTPQSELPPSHPPIGDMGGMMSGAGQGAPAMASSGTKPTWQVPAGWQEVPGGQFLVAKFSVSGPDNSQAAVNVSSSPGEGGGLAGNINRWRGQLGLGALAQADIDKLVTTVDCAGGKAMFVDMAGTDAKSGQSARLVGAMVPRSGQTWFYKLMGNSQAVEQQKDAFAKFVQTARY
jgi:hypothetical protein